MTREVSSSKILELSKLRFYFDRKFYLINNTVTFGERMHRVRCIFPMRCPANYAEDSCGACDVFNKQVVFL